LRNFVTNLRYLKESKSIGIIFKDDLQYSKRLLKSNYVAYLYARQSITRYTFTIVRLLLNWAIFQPTMTFSTIKVKYMALVNVTKEGIWWKSLMENFEFTRRKTIIFCDSLSVICLAKDCVQYGRHNILVSNITFFLVKRVLM